MNIIDYYKELSFEEKMIYSTKISIIWNIILSVGKFIISIFGGVFFLIAGIINIFTSMSKIECLRGLKNEDTFKKRNIVISIFLFLSGLQYTIYMASIIFWNRSTINTGMILGIMIALVSFIELGIAITGLIKVKSKGHIYRNIKIINFSSALTAIVLTEISIMSFASNTDNTLINGIFGIVVGVVIMLLSLFIYFAPRYSIIDRTYNVYKSNENVDDLDINIRLKESFWYGGYSYKAEVKDNICRGYIIKDKSRIMSLNIYIEILLIILSEILIFVYAIGYIVYYIKCIHLIDDLDKIMFDNNYKKINEFDKNEMA